MRSWLGRAPIRPCSHPFDISARASTREEARRSTANAPEESRNSSKPIHFSEELVQKEIVADLAVTCAPVCDCAAGVLTVSPEIFA